MFSSVGEIIGLTVLGLFVLVIIIIYFCKCYSDYTVGRFRDKMPANPAISNDFDLALLDERNASVDGATGIDNEIDAEPIQGDHNDFSLVIESYARNSMRKQQHKTPIIPAAAAQIQRQSETTSQASVAASMPLTALAAKLYQNEPALNSKSIEVEVQVHNKDQYPSSYKAQPSIVPFSPPTNPAPPPQPYANLRKEQPVSTSKHTEDPRRAFRKQSESSQASDPLDKQYPADVPIQRYPSQDCPKSPIMPPKELYKPEPQFVPPQPVAKPPAPPARSEYMNLGVAKPLPPDYLNLVKKKPAPPTPPVPKPQTPELPARDIPAHVVPARDIPAHVVPARVMSPAIKEKFNSQLSERLIQKETAAEPPSTRTPRTPKKSRKVPDHLVSESKPKTPKSAKKVRKGVDDHGLVTSPSQLKARKAKPKSVSAEENVKPLDDITNGQNTPAKNKSYKTNINSYSGDQNGGDYIDKLCSPQVQQQPFVYNPDNAAFDYMLSPKLRRNDNAKNSEI